MEDRWERLLAEDLGAELRDARLALCRALLADREAGRPDALHRLRAGRERQFDAMAEVMNDLRTLPSLGLPALSVAIRTLARLAAAPGADAA